MLLCLWYQHYIIMASPLICPFYSFTSKPIIIIKRLTSADSRWHVFIRTLQDCWAQISNHSIKQQGGVEMEPKPSNVSSCCKQNAFNQMKKPSEGRFCWMLPDIAVWLREQNTNWSELHSSDKHILVLISCSSWLDRCMMGSCIWFVLICTYAWGCFKGRKTTLTITLSDFLQNRDHGIVLWYFNRQEKLRSTSVWRPLSFLPFAQTTRPPFQMSYSVPIKDIDNGCCFSSGGGSVYLEVLQRWLFLSLTFRKPREKQKSFLLSLHQCTDLSLAAQAPWYGLLLQACWHCFCECTWGILQRSFVLMCRPKKSNTLLSVNI